MSRHRCLIYEGPPARQLPVVVPMITVALKDSFRCVYLGPMESHAMMRGSLAAKGVDTSREEQRGALVFSDDRSYLKAGFHPKAMVEMLGALVDSALHDGFAGLCATGDMAWELGDEKNLDKVLEYEALLETSFAKLPMRGLCQYRREAVAPRALQAALLAHEEIHVEDSTHRENHFYVPPDLLLENPEGVIKDKQGEWMWGQLSNILAAEKQRDEARRRLETANAELERRVHERTRELETFTHSAAHDLRAPLRTISGFADILARRHGAGLPAEAKEHLGRISGGAKQMAAIIDGLAALARLSTAEMQVADTDLSGLASDAVASLREAEPARVVEVVVAPGLAAKGDARLLQIALTNLLGNAWKFTSKVEGARIEFGGLQRDGVATYFVRDNGAGFDMEHGDGLFKPFRRFHASSEFPGTGLGLATTRRIVERHGGRIWAEAAEGKGAAFYFTLGS